MSRTYRRAKALDVLIAERNQRWSTRHRTPDGWIGDADHQRRTSDHNPWVPPPRGGVVTAQDLRDDVDGVATCEVIAETIRRRRDPRVKYMIWRGRMCSSYATRTHAAWTWRPYSGPNGHFTHMHVSVQPSAGLYDSTAPWGLLAPVPASREDDDVTPQDKADIINGVTANLLAKLQPKGGEPIGDELDKVRRDMRRLGGAAGLAVAQGVPAGPVES